MRFRSLVWLLFVISSLAWANTTTKKQQDSIQNSTGGSLLAVPSTGTTLATDTNTLTFTGKSLSGSTNTFSNIGVSSVLFNNPFVPTSNGVYSIGSAADELFSVYTEFMSDSSNKEAQDLNNRYLVGSDGSTVNFIYSTPGQVEIPSGNLKMDGATSGYVQILSDPVTTPHIVQLPPNVCSSGGYWTDDGSGHMSCQNTAPANVNLSNVTATSIGASLIPNPLAPTTPSLGSSSSGWQNLYVTDILDGQASTNSIDVYNRVLYANDGSTQNASWISAGLFEVIAGALAVDGVITDSSEVETIDPLNRQLIANDGATVVATYSSTAQFETNLLLQADSGANIAGPLTVTGVTGSLGSNITLTSGNATDLATGSVISIQGGGNGSGYGGTVQMTAGNSFNAGTGALVAAGGGVNDGSGGQVNTNAGNSYNGGLGASGLVGGAPATGNGGSYTLSGGAAYDATTGATLTLQGGTAGGPVGQVLTTANIIPNGNATLTLGEAGFSFIGILWSVQDSSGTSAWDVTNRIFSDTTGSESFRFGSPGTVLYTATQSPISSEAADSGTSSLPWGNIWSGTGNFYQYVATGQGVAPLNGNAVLAIEGPIQSQTTGGVPTYTVQTGAGSGATCSDGSGLSSNTDTVGVVQIVQGTTGLTTGAKCQINFSNGYDNAVCVISPDGATAAIVQPYITYPSSTSNFEINFGTAGVIGTTYLFSYICMDTNT